MKIHQEVLTFPARGEKTTHIDITKDAQKVITESSFVQGIVLIHTLHTTMGLTKSGRGIIPDGYLVQENEPLLLEDLSGTLGEGAEKLLRALPHIAAGRKRFLDFLPRNLLDPLLGFLIAILRPTGYFKHDDFSIRTENMTPGENKNATAHLKAAMIRESLLWSFSGGKLNLGTWQSMLFWDFDPEGRNERRIQIVVIGE